ncbi:putative ankyrin repeat-containing domain-containing protein [Helianthus anomalus]
MPTYFPLRWESTGDQWWFASSIEWAAANGHYDLFKCVTKNRRFVARRLLHEGECKRGKSLLIGSGYGGWLLYTTASAGDLHFVQEFLQKDPFLVFGEGEYGVTDILYAAARRKNCEVFWVIYDFAMSARFMSGNGRESEEHIGEITFVYHQEMKNRTVHALARGGNLKMLKELLSDSSVEDVLAYRDAQCSTILHTATACGQVKVVKDLISLFRMTNSTDKQGNTALHIAAYRGQLLTVEVLIQACPESIHSRNNV